MTDGTQVQVVQRRPSQSKSRRLAVAGLVFLLFVCAIHLAWKAGYRANPAHHKDGQVVATDLASLRTNLPNLWAWIVPALAAVLGNAFKDYLTDVVVQGWIGQVFGWLKRKFAWI